MKYILRPSAEKKFAKLDLQTQTRIIKKLEYIISSNNPLEFAESLTHHEIGQYRFRVGNYRVIFDVEQETIIILTLGHRKDVYK